MEWTANNLYWECFQVVLLNSTIGSFVVFGKCKKKVCHLNKTELIFLLSSINILKFSIWYLNRWPNSNILIWYQFILRSLVLFVISITLCLLPKNNLCLCYDKNIYLPKCARLSGKIPFYQNRGAVDLCCKLYFIV